MLIRSVFLLSNCVLCLAQSLEINPVTVDRGSANIFRIILKPVAEKPIAALQWDVVYGGGLRIAPSWILPGAAAEIASKVVTCGPKPSQGSKHRWACILAGGVQPLPAGVVAIIRFEAASDAPRGEMTVELEGIAGASPGTEAISIKNVNAVITVR